MKNTILTIVTFFLATIIFAQDTATIKVIVLNEFNKTLTGEQVIFESQDSDYTTKKATDENGFCYVKLIGGETYNIKIKTIGEALEYNTLKIPALGEGQQYSENVLTITIYESKSFTLDNVYFDSGKSTLKSSSNTELNELFEFMKLKENIKIQILGHTDNVGNDDSNFLLSENRAKAVKQFLTNKGINSNRIEVKAFGENQPIATNDTEEGRSKNRRIEVLVL